MKVQNKKQNNLMYIGGGIITVIGLVSILFLASNGSQLQGYLPNITTTKVIAPVNPNLRISTVKDIALSKVTCKAVVTDSGSPGFKTIGWTAEVTNATPNPSSNPPNSSDEANIYKLVWFMDDCGKKSSPQGWEGTGIQVDCPKTQKTAKITVVASFKEADGNNNVANCSVNL